MKTSHSTRHTIEFSDLEIAVPHEVTKGLNKAIIVRVTMSLEDFDEAGLDEEPYFDYSLRAWRCNANGQRDGRQTRPEGFLFNNTVDLYTCLLGLLEHTEQNNPCEVARRLEAHIRPLLEAAKQHRREMLEKLLS